jgi:hypothetical protein
MEVLVDEAQVEARFGPFGDSANLDVDRCTVCAECTIGSKIIWNLMGHVESCFGLFGDSVSLGAR